MRRPRTTMCRSCGYDLSATLANAEAVCPECGADANGAEREDAAMARVERTERGPSLLLGLTLALGTVSIVTGWPFYEPSSGLCLCVGGAIVTLIGAQNPAHLRREAKAWRRPAPGFAESYLAALRHIALRSVLIAFAIALPTLLLLGVLGT